MNIDKIRKALKEDDWCQAMKDLGYEIVSFDDDEGGWATFTDIDKEVLIYVDKEEDEFATYLKAGKYALDEEQVK